MPPESRFKAIADTHELEEGARLAPRFDAQGLVPAIVTDAETGGVLMLAYMNDAALARTLETGEAHYYSRSRQALWRKGATSGQVQEVLELRIDCDQDSLWLKVRQHGSGCCHVGYRSCFYRKAGLDQGVKAGLVTDLEKTGGAS